MELTNPYEDIDDEFAFLKFNKLIYMSSTPANAQAALEAKNNGKPYGKLITTTPGDLNTPHGIYCYNFFDNTAPFKERLYDMNKAEVQEYVNMNSKNNFLYIKYSYKQLGRSEKWFNQQCRDLNGDLLAIRRELLLEWCHSSDLSPFSSTDLYKLSQSIHDPVGTLFVKKYYPFNIYKDFNFNGKLLIGVDFAAGLDEDNTAITIADETGEVLADFRNSIIDVPETVELIIELMTNYFPNSVLFPERNNVGITAIQMLLRVPKVSNRIYYEKKEAKGEKRASADFDKTTGKFYTKVYGINTGSDSRPKMIDMIPDFISHDLKILHSRNLINDIIGLQRKKTKGGSRIDHADDGHDDSLFSYLMIRYTLAFGTNLHHFAITKRHHSEDESIDELQEMSQDNYRRQLESVTLLNRASTMESYSTDIYQDFQQRQMNVNKATGKKQDIDEQNRSMLSVFALNKL